MISRKSSDGSRTIVTAAFAVLLLAQVAFAQVETIFGKGTEWMVWSAIIMMITATLLGIAYMASKVFQLPSTEAWVKEEFVNMLFSAFIIVMFIMFAGVIESVANSLAGDILASSVSESGTVSYWQYQNTGRWERIATSSPACPYPCQFYIARGFLGSTYEIYGEALKGIAKAQAVSMLFETFGVSTTFSMIPYVPIIDIAVGFPFYPGRAAFNNTLGTVVSEYLKILAALKMGEIGLAYLAGLASTFFVIGILSRILWFTRKFGGLLVALGIGIYTMVPLVYVLGWYTIDRSTVTFGDSLQTFEGVSFGELGGFGGGDIEPLFTEYDAVGKASPGILDTLARAYLPIIILPMLSIFVLIGFVRQFSPMIGGDNEIAGLTKII